MQVIFRPDLVYAEFTQKGLDLFLQSNHGAVLRLVFDDDTLGTLVGYLLSAYGDQDSPRNDDLVFEGDQQEIPF